MADERTFDTTINLGGLIIPVEVEFTITAYGSGPSGYGFDGSFDPGDPDEFHITRVIATDSGLDLTKACDQATLDLRVSEAFTPDPRQDPVRAALFGFRVDEWLPVPRVTIYHFAPYRRVFIHQGETILEAIEAEIMMDADALKAPEVDDYDPRDWE